MIMTLMIMITLKMTTKTTIIIIIMMTMTHGHMIQHVKFFTIYICDAPYKKGPHQNSDKIIMGTKQHRPIPFNNFKMTV